METSRKLKEHRELVDKISNLYNSKYNCYNLTMFVLLGIKKNNKEQIRDGLICLFENFKNEISSLILIFEYLKAKKCSSYNSYCEILLYLNSFNSNRINANLQFI